MKHIINIRADSKDDVAVFFFFFFNLLLVVVFQLCIQKVQSDGLPEVNDLKKERKQEKMKEEG